MAKGATFGNHLLLHLFNNAALTLIGDAAGLLASAAEGSLYVSLHTADPGTSGDQTTNEIAYTSYARVAVARNSGGWTVSGSNVTNTAAVNFPACTGSSGTATYFAIGTAASGAGKRLYSGQITSPSGGLAISTGITPIINASGITVTEG